MITQEKIQNLLDARNELDAAKRRGMGVSGPMNRVTNLLREYMYDLLDVAKENQILREENDALSAAIAEQDKELDMLKKTAGVPRTRKKGGDAA